MTSINPTFAAYEFLVGEFAKWCEGCERALLMNLHQRTEEPVLR